MNTELIKKNRVTQFVRPNDPDDLISMDEVLTYAFPVPADIADPDNYELPVCTVVDIGSHIGSYVVAVKARYPDAEVVAIEPDPDNYEVLALNCQRLPGTLALKARVGYDDQTVYLMKHPDHSTCNAIVRAEDVRSDGSYSTAPRAVSLSEVMALRGWDEISIVKIDAEGAEVPFFAETPDDVLRKVCLFVGEHHSTPDEFKLTIGRHLEQIGYRVSVEPDPNRHSTFSAWRMDK